MVNHPPADRQELFQAYVNMGDTRSYQRVADQYGVAKHTITRIAMEHDWLGRLKLIEDEARRAADKKLAEARAEAYERHIKLSKLIQSKALQGLQAHAFDSARDSAKAIVEGVKLERVAMGESTEQHTVSVQQITRREVEMLVAPSLFPDEDEDEEADVDTTVEDAPAGSEREADPEA